ncbi:MAG: TolC family protein [Myxococcus sp.]|nr:TolC family protein [Myxococcus sp.]
MNRLLLALPLLSACATHLAHDVRTVEASLSERGQLADLALPRFDAPNEDPVEVETLLARPLSADDAVRVALLMNRDARAALAEIGIARGQYVTAGLLPNPEVELSVRDPGGPQPLQLDLGLELSITATVLAPLRAAVAESHLEAERLRATGSLLDLAYQARVSFYEAQAAQQRLELRLRALESQQASYATAVDLNRLGNLPAIALANELAAVELSRVQVAEAENALLDAREALTQRLGLAGKRTRFTLAASLAIPPAEPRLDDAETRAVTSSLELLELERRAETASRKVGLARTQGWLPHLTAGFHGERDGNLWELGAHVAVGLPVFDRAQGQRLSAQSEYDAVLARAEAKAVVIRSLTRASLNRVESASRRARHYAERLVPARQKQLDETVKQYNAMTLGVFQVLQVQRGVTESALAQVDATLDYWRARAGLDLLLAGRSTPLKMGAAPPSSAAAAMNDSGGH